VKVEATDRLSGGELSAAISSALVGIHAEHLGRGSGSASTFEYSEVLVTLLRGVLLPVEKFLTDGNRGRLWDTSASSSTRRWRRTSARLSNVSLARTCARSSAVTTSTADVAAELFILDGPARKPGCGRVGLIRGRSVAL
jgi:Na+-translocating membrane potential-generating system (MpsC)